MSESLLWPWFAAFLSTIIIESPILALFARHHTNVPIRHVLLMSLALQMTTHPALWLVFHDLSDAIGSYAGALVLAEGTIFAVESILLAWMWPGHARLAWVAAFTANIASTAVGLLR